MNEWTVETESQTKGQYVLVYFTIITEDDDEFLDGNIFIDHRGCK